MTRTFSITSVLLCLSIFSNVSNAAENTFSDPYAKVHSSKLANGLKVVIAPNDDAKTFQIKVRVDGGVFNEEEGKAGTAHLLEHYLFTDAKAEKDMTYLEVIKEKGGSGNAMTMPKATVYYATVPGNLAPWLVGVFGKILFGKSFDEERVQQAKGPVFLEIGRPNIFDYITYPLQSLWPDFARPSDFWQTEFGIREPMRRISADKIQTAGLTSDDLKRFYEREYFPGNMTVFLAGKFDESTLIDQVGNDFGKEPKREGRGWVDPLPKARKGVYFRSEVTSGVPHIEVGTKVANVSLEDEIVGRTYLEYLAHRLMKELRNVRGETYTVRPEIALKKGSGSLTVKFEAPQSEYQQNLKYVTDLIDHETRRGEFTKALFDEAKALSVKGYQRIDHDSGTMMYMAERADFIEKDYGLQSGHVDDYQAVSNLTYEDFDHRLKVLFAEDMEIKDLSEPPLFFRFESLIMMVLAFAFWMRFSRFVFAKQFAHNQIRWVRKMSYPPAYSLQFLSTVALLVVSALIYGAMDVFWLKADFLLHSFLVSDYLFSVVLLGLVLLSAQCLFAILARKVMVVGDSFWIKSLGYYSSKIGLDEIEKVEVCSPLSVLFSPHTLLQIKYRYYYYDICFWKKGLLVCLKNGRSHFIGVRSAEEAASEIRLLIEKHGSKPTRERLTFQLLPDTSRKKRLTAVS